MQEWASDMLKKILLFFVYCCMAFGIMWPISLLGMKIYFMIFPERDKYDNNKEYEEKWYFWPLMFLIGMIVILGFVWVAILIQES
jgi:NADH:ubiquinone oxidoreductase subunit 5 (subunit L)/multisubunit Na+/H+ antiporter MnhA subunit